MLLALGGLQRRSQRGHVELRIYAVFFAGVALTFFDAIFARYARDTEMTRLLGWPRHDSVDATLAFLEFSDAEWEK